MFNLSTYLPLSRTHLPPPWRGRVGVGGKCPWNLYVCTSPTPCPPPVKGGGTDGSTEHRTNSVGGFTLIELMVVIFILSMAAMLVFPRLPGTDGSDLKSSARSIAATFRYLGDKAIATKTHYRINLSLSDNSLTVTRVSGGEERSTDDTFLNKRTLAGSVTFQDVQIPRLGTLTDEEVLLDFGAGGLEDFVIIHLRSAGGGQMTVTAHPRNGKVQIDEGYQEMKL